MWEYNYDYLCHGKFKYIDKYLSKAKNWVYVYADKKQDFQRYKKLKNAYVNIKKQLDNSAPKNRQERESMQKQLDLLKESIRKQYGDDALSKINSSAEFRPRSRKKNILSGTGVVEKKDITLRDRETQEKIKNYITKMNDGSIRGNAYTDVLNDLIYWYNGGVGNPDFANKVDNDTYIKYIEKLYKEWEKLESNDPGGRTGGLTYIELQNFIERNRR